MSPSKSAVNQLLALARDQFGADFDSGGTEVDTKFFTGMADGTFADYSAHKDDKDANDKANDPANAEDWGPERALQADRIEWLCTDADAAALVSRKGIQVHGARIDDALDLRRVRFDRTLCFAKCAFTQRPDFSDASFFALYLDGTHGPGFKLHRLHLAGDLHLRRGFVASGEVDLLGAFIGGSLDCSSGSFLNKGGTALKADTITVTGNVFLSGGFNAEGKVNFVRADVQGGLQYRNVKEPANATLDLRHAKVSLLWDDSESWPEGGNLLLRGFEYESLSDKATVDADERIGWLSRDGGEGFSPQPYEQLAKVLSRSGHREEARAIRVEKERELAKKVRYSDPKRRWTRITGRGRWWWNLAFGKLTDFGYRSWKVLPIIAVIILAGWPLYDLGYTKGSITPTRTDSKLEPYSEGPAVYPTFQGLSYSFDAFVPLVNVEQVDYWLPNAYCGPRLKLGGRYYVSWSGCLLLFYYFQVVSGWILTTFLVTGLTRLVQRED